MHSAAFTAERLPLRSSVKVCLEVTLVFGFVIGICKILYSFRTVPFIAETLPVWAAALFLYVPLFLLRRTRTRPEEWGITLDRFALSLNWFVGFSILFLPAFVILYWLYRSWWFHLPMGVVFPPDWLLLLLYHLVCVALPEEVFYRGYMQSRLNRVFPRPVNLLSGRVGVGWLYTALLFALGHYIISLRPEALATFFPGLLFGWLRERTGSVVASTAFHALCNATVLLLN
jgi:membrane protease YdiL (CAAX protease family)